MLNFYESCLEYWNHFSFSCFLRISKWLILRDSICSDWFWVFHQPVQQQNSSHFIKISMDESFNWNDCNIVCSLNCISSCHSVVWKQWYKEIQKLMSNHLRCLHNTWLECVCDRRWKKNHGLFLAKFYISFIVLIWNCLSIYISIKTYLL